MHDENESNDNITALTTVDADIPAVIARRKIVLSEQQLDLLNHTIAKDLSHEEMALFGEVCRRMQLDPFSRQIYAIKRGGRLTFQVGIDGFRSKSEGTGKYGGMLGPMWCGEDGVWHDVWLSAKPPVAAKVGIIRRDFVEPIWAVARYAAYKVDQNPLWTTMPETMIAKCAEAIARRITFPDALGGVYAPEEMEQADRLPLVRHAGRVVDASTGEVLSEPEQPRRPQPAQRANGKPATANGNGNGKARAVESEPAAEVNWGPVLRRLRECGITAPSDRDKFALWVAKKTWEQLGDADFPKVVKSVEAIEAKHAQAQKAVDAAQGAPVVDADPTPPDDEPEPPEAA